MIGFKECSSCGALCTKSCGCSKEGFVDKSVHDPNKTPDSSQGPPHDCLKCGNPVDGLHCRQCALLRKKMIEVWFTIYDEHKIFQDFLNTSESSNDNTNVVNVPQEPFVFNQDPDENSSQSPSHIDHHCCYGCGDLLDGIFKSLLLRLVFSLLCGSENSLISPVGSLVVGSSRLTSKVSGEMASPVAVGALRSTLSIMMVVAFRVQSLNVGVSPRQGISLKSTSCKLNLTCDCAVASMENRFNLFEQLSKTNNSFSTLEIQGLTFEEVSVGALMNSRHLSSSASS
uniref:Uncharacterized protein n=1 Tax=Tanacetum cinerariifolium TaxID=118510 RepID=A0A6L2N6E8_TANCI|nr:hypothetical protein [Tanacetum cinerariifolium]